jgi:uncharacterized protein (DUF433 family)
MPDPTVQEVSTKIDDIWQAIARLEARLNEFSERTPPKIRTEHPHIVRVQGVCGRRPVIEGPRLSVKLIVGWTREGLSPEQILELYPHLSATQIADALAYYEDHPEEIEAEFAEERRYVEVEIPRLQAIDPELKPQAPPAAAPSFRV